MHGKGSHFSKLSKQQKYFQSFKWKWGTRPIWYIFQAWGAFQIYLLLVKGQSQKPWLKKFLYFDKIMHNSQEHVNYRVVMVHLMYSIIPASVGKMLKNVKPIWNNTIRYTTLFLSGIGFWPQRATTFCPEARKVKPLVKRVLNSLSGTQGVSISYFTL